MWKLRITPKDKSDIKLRINFKMYGRIVNSTNIGGKDYAADGSELKSTKTESRQRLLLKIVR